MVGDGAGMAVLAEVDLGAVRVDMVVLAEVDLGAVGADMAVLAADTAAAGIDKS